MFNASDCTVYTRLRIKILLYRSGKVGIDARTLIKLVVSAAGNLSHIFLVVIYFSALYWFIFFKQQNYVHTVLPAEDQEAFIKHYLISAFSLKILDIVVLILGQVTVDVFLLDWERPPPSTDKIEKVKKGVKKHDVTCQIYLSMLK